MGFHVQAVDYWPSPDQFDYTPSTKYGSPDIDLCVKQPLVIEVGSVESSDWSFSPPGSATFSIPSLEQDEEDTQEGGCQTRGSKKLRSVFKPTFVPCSEKEHPLYYHLDKEKDPLDNTADRNSAKDIKMSLKLNALFDQRMMKLRSSKHESLSSSLSLWGADTRDREEQFPSEFDVIAGQDRELTLFDVRAKMHFGIPRKRSRLNSDFLRQFVAERQMLQNGKINYIPTRPILPPRLDHVMAEPADVVLGISARWRKVRRNRDWRQLDANSFVTH